MTYLARDRFDGKAWSDWSPAALVPDAVRDWLDNPLIVAITVKSVGGFRRQWKVAK